MFVRLSFDVVTFEWCASMLVKLNGYDKHPGISTCIHVLKLGLLHTKVSQTGYTHRLRLPQAL